LQNVPWLRAKLTKIPEGIGSNGSVSTGTGDVTEASIIGNGWGVVTNFFNFTTPDRKARRISSTESFRNEMTICAALALGSNQTVKITTWMLGIVLVICSPAGTSSGIGTVLNGWVMEIAVMRTETRTGSA